LLSISYRYRYFTVGMCCGFFFRRFFVPPFKRQCHEIMIEMSPWSSSLCLTFFSVSFFSFFRLKTYGPYSRASVDVKAGTPDPADFAMTRLLICQLWHFAQWFGRPLAYRAVTSAICQRSAQGAFRDMPVVAQTIAHSAKNHQWIRCRVVAKSTGSEDPVLTSKGALLYGP
jgi:hypothetical protein